MIYIDWYQQDWLKWLPIFLGGIVGVILFLRLLRRLTRWTKIKVSHVSQQYINIEGELIPVYQRLQQAVNTQEESQIQPSLILITPVSAHGGNNYHLAVGLAAAGWTVYNLTVPYVIKWLDSKEFSQKLITFCQKQYITHGIVFDYATPLILSQIAHMETIQWTFIRPQFHENRILRRYKQSLSQDIYNSHFFDSYQPKKDTFFIEPSADWLSPSVKKNFNQFKMKIKNINPNNWITIKSGGWSFIGQETVVFGYILGIISEKSI